MSSPPPLELVCSRHFLAWLHDAHLSLAFTTYQTNRLFLVGLKPDGSLSTFERHFDRPMGLFATSERLYLNTRWQLWELDHALPEGDVYETYDRLYVPRRAHTTGELDIHDIAVNADAQIYFVNSLYSCLATTSERYSFKPVWQPKFISQLAPEDRCHLNGLALDPANGEPRYVTAVSRSDVAAGWRDRRASGGILLDVAQNEIVLQNLSMPHSPRIYRGRVWLQNSGTGEFGYADLERGAFVPICFCPGFMRGLAFYGKYAIVGLSKPRHEKTFTGLALDENLRAKDAEPRCGLWVIDLDSGLLVHSLELEGVAVELYDVQVLPGVRRPMALGFKTDEIQRLITIDAAPRPVFHALTLPQASGDTGTDASRVNPSSAVRDDTSYAPTIAPRVPAAKPVTVVSSTHSEYVHANALVKQKKYAEAILHYQAVLEHEPGHFNARLNLGTCYWLLGNLDAAVEQLRLVIAGDPKNVQAHSNLAGVLRARGELKPAIQQYRRACELNPTAANLENDLGVALYEFGLLDHAQQAFERALALDPNFAQAHNHLAGVFNVKMDFDAALKHHHRAAELEPDSFLAYENIGKIHEQRSETRQAAVWYRRALQIKNDAALAFHVDLLCPPILATARAVDEYLAYAEEVVNKWQAREIPLELARVQSSRVEPPYEWTYLGRDTSVLKATYADLFQGFAERSALPRRESRTTRGAPYHIGFVVTPGHEGVFMRCMQGIVNLLDPQRFHPTLVCARTGEAILRAGITHPHARYVRIPLRFDHMVSQMYRAQFDLIYYWEVGTDSSNYFMPFLRLAPVQCTGWGWPDTSAAPELDYHLTSEGLTTPDSDALYAETLVRLPHLPPFFFRPPIADERRIESRVIRTNDERHAMYSLPLSISPSLHHLYLCSQTLRKVHPEFDALVGEILRHDAQGVVVFIGDTHPAPGEMLRARWREQLPDVQARIHMLPRLAPAEYFRVVANADVILDTLYFGGSNTAYDAFAMGVPVVTLPTQFPRGRYTYALYREIEMDACIADSPRAYVELATRLGKEADFRAEVSAQLRERAPAVFEQRAAVTQLENFFVQALGEA